MTLFGWTAKLVTEALGLPAATWDHAYTGLTTDTRAMQDGDLFVALKGERFDAHDFLGDARLAGVGGVVVRHGTPRWPGFDWFEVDDTLVALGQLARLRREQFSGPVVAVTGTNGKTSTKELIAAALGAKFTVHKSEKNLNNLVGVPLTVLAAPLEAGAMVVECGASVVGEIGRMRKIVRPDIAIVTNVGEGHLEGFGSREAVLDEKSQLLVDAPIAIVGKTPAVLPETAQRAAKKVVVAATEAPAHWFAESVTMSADGRPTFMVRGVKIELPLYGRHMVANALIALAAADACGVPLADAAMGLAKVALPGGRSETMEIEGVTVINDCYNANPASLRAALDLLRDIRGKRRAIVVVGTMRELGDASSALHREAAKQVIDIGPDVVAAVGDFAEAFAVHTEYARATKLLTGENPEDVAAALRPLIKPGDVVLLKASRGVRLERLLPLLWPSLQPAEAH
ncbi:MAG TPA: UDP-N-acetylmuramoyl-tripeptide--D-alanyl-D-alanine ligase [Gemmatimonadales bacterium]|jgi:UDP-N-acetylmuramoyl-tripeptide--D-alanyl-D-alanine ligase